MEPDLARIIADIPQALVDGLTVESAHGRVTLRHQHVGDLIVTSGALVACDPMVIEEDTIWPFTIHVPPGRYPTILSIVHFTRDRRVGYATLRLNAQSPTRWQVATFLETALSGAPAIEERATATGDYIPGYGVDTGIGCFMDADAAQVWARRINTIANADHVIHEAMDRNGVDTCSWATVSLEPETPANLIAFSAGIGDGSYASYVGYDGDGAVACLVTDFSLLWRDR